MTTAAPPVRTPAGTIIPARETTAVNQRALLLSAALTLVAIAAVGVLSWWYPLAAFFAVGAGAGYSLSGSV